MLYDYWHSDRSSRSLEPFRNLYNRGLRNWLRSELTKHGAGFEIPLTGWIVDRRFRRGGPHVIRMALVVGWRDLADLQVCQDGGHDQGGEDQQLLDEVDAQEDRQQQQLQLQQIQQDQKRQDHRLLLLEDPPVACWTYAINLLESRKETSEQSVQLSC